MAERVEELGKALKKAPKNGKPPGEGSGHSNKKRWEHPKSQAKRQEQPTKQTQTAKPGQQTAVVGQQKVVEQVRGVRPKWNHQEARGRATNSSRGATKSGGTSPRRPTKVEPPGGPGQGNKQQSWGNKKWWNKSAASDQSGTTR